MIRIDRTRTPTDLVPKIDRLFALSAGKIRSIEQSSRPGDGAPVFTVEGRYTARGWTEWTEGFQYGSSLLQFDATGEREFLELGRERTLTRMAPHLTHVGVHDHGFNNVSTYGALWRLALEGRIDASEWERRFYALALKVSGAVQARRWTTLPDGGYIYSFNGAHSLFVDTIRSLRALALSHLLGHRLVEEQDAQVNLLARLVQHAQATARYNVFYARSGGPYDVRGRVAHESLFNVANGTYRGPEHAAGLLALQHLDARARVGHAGLCRAARVPRDAHRRRRPVVGSRERRAGAPRRGARHVRLLYRLGRLRRWHPLLGHRRARAVGARRLGQPRGRSLQRSRAGRQLGRGHRCAGTASLRHVSSRERGEDGSRYTQAGLRVLDTLFDEAGPYLSQDPNHQGLLLHSVYHWPNGWDHVPAGARVPRGESSQWGDYHAREAALYVKRLAENGAYLAFYGPGRQAAHGLMVRAQGTKTSE